MNWNATCLYIFFLIKLNNFQILNTFVKTVLLTIENKMMFNYDLVNEVVLMTGLSLSLLFDTQTTGKRIQIPIQALLLKCLIHESRVLI